MMKNIVLYSIGLLISLPVFAQRPRTKIEYQKQVEKFYEHLLSERVVSILQAKDLFGADDYGEFEEDVYFKDCTKKHINSNNCRKKFDLHYHNDKSESIFFLKYKAQATALSQNLDLSQIRKIIKDSSTLIDVGVESSVYLRLSFPNQRKIYFTINKYPDETPDIGEIFLPDGAGVDNKILSDHHAYLEIDGCINDPEGFVNVRKDANAQSPIVATIKKGEKFVYTPNADKKWWKVKKIEKPAVKGYVYFDRLQPDKNWKEIQ